MSFNEDFSQIQIERRTKKIAEILDKLDKAGLGDEIPVIFDAMAVMLVDAYNAGFIDSQNETKDTLKL